MRVESLSAANNGFNGGDLNNDNNPANDLYPLYVDENGDFTLEFLPMMNSGDLDALNDSNLPTSTCYLPNTDTNGYEETNIVTYTITTQRPTLLEIKYGISFDVYLNPAEEIINDNIARFVLTYFTVTNSDNDTWPRKYGPCTNNYSSGSIDSVTGPFYNSSSAYIWLPSADTFTLTLVGHVRSFVRWTGGGGEPGPPSESTYVKFATDHDFVFFRMH